MVKARRLCPDAVVVPPRFERYREVSAAIMRVFSEFSPDVEALSLDEAFLDMTGAGEIFGDPAQIGWRIQDAVYEATNGLTASLGLSGTKYVAKVASAFDKPNGLTIVPPMNAKSWLAPLPVSRLWGAGKKTQARLTAMGLQTIGDVANADPAFLVERLGNAGYHFYALSHAEDPRKVARRHVPKSIGSEQTLMSDIPIGAALRRHLQRSADRIASRLKKKNLIARGVRVKLKTAQFQILTRQRSLDPATDVAEILLKSSIELLEAFDHAGLFRLVGMAAFDLLPGSASQQLDLFSSNAKRRRLESAIDALNERYSSPVVRRGTELADRRRDRLGATLDFLDDN